MWQRFTERARRVVFFAQEEASNLGENYVSTEHLLLGLVKEDDSVAARLLDQLGAPADKIRSEIARQIARGDGRLGSQMQLAPRVKRVLDLAYDEARALDEAYIGTEHLLLGLLREGEGLAARVLAKLGVVLEPTRAAVQALFSTPEPIAPLPYARQLRFLGQRILVLAPELETASLEELRAALFGPPPQDNTRAGSN